MRRKLFIAAATALATAAALCAAPAGAADFPARAVQMVVPFTPGGDTDHLGRMFAEKLASLWKQPVVVQNRPGAGASLGAAQVAAAPPDGYTLLMASAGMVMNPLLMKKLPYDPKALVPVALVASGPNVLYVKSSLPVNSVQELVAWAKANPGKLTFANSGNGTSTHLAAELFAARAGIDMVNVPYKGAGPAQMDLVGQQVDAYFSVLNLMPYAKQGKVRALAVASERRVAEAPELPTVDESGIRGVYSGPWFGIYAPAGLPPAVMASIGDAVKAVADDPAMKKQIAHLPLTPDYRGTGEFTRFMQEETARWSEVIRSHAIVVD